MGQNLVKKARFKMLCDLETNRGVNAYCLEMMSRSRFFPWVRNNSETESFKMRSEIFDKRKRFECSILENILILPPTQFENVTITI